MAGDDIWKVGDIYSAVVSVGPDGTLIRETYRVRDGGADKVDDTELDVPGNGAGNEIRGRASEWNGLLS